jgi:hypothetical protein
MERKHGLKVTYDSSNKLVTFEGPLGIYSIPYDTSKIHEISFIKEVSHLIGASPKDVLSATLKFRFPEYLPDDVENLKLVIHDPKMSLIEKFGFLKKKSDSLRNVLSEKLKIRLINRLRGAPETPTDPIEIAKTFEIAEEIVKITYDLGFRFVKTVEGNIFIYDRGQLVTYDVFAEELLALFGISRSAIKHELDLAVKVNAETVDAICFNPKGYILCNNCILDIWEMKVLEIPKEPDINFLFTFRLNWNISPTDIQELDNMKIKDWKDKIPKTMEFLQRLFPNEEFNKVLEMLGALVIPSYVRKIWLIIGPPGVGKTVLKEFLLDVFKPAASSYSLDWITTSEFNFQLLGKLVNISSEGARSLISVNGIERLKRYSGEESIHFEEKYRPPLMGRNIIKMVFMLNEYPQFQYLDEAFLDRLYLIDTTSEAIKEQKPEPHVLKELLEERDTFVTFILWCMRNLLKERYINFKHDLTLDEKKELFTQVLNPVVSWIEEKCDKEGKTERKTLYAAFLKWAQENSKPIMSDKQFYSMLRSLGYTDRKIKGEWFFMNLKLKEPESKTLIHTKCEKCGKLGARPIMREDGIHYLCHECLTKWEGNL